MPQVHISEWLPSPRSSTFDPSIHAMPTHPPELDFHPDFDTRMKSPSPADAAMTPPPLPTTPKRTKKLARIGGGGGPRRPTALFISPRRVSPTKIALAEATGRRARIYSGSSPGRSISGSSLRVAGNAIAGSPECLALLSSASPSRSRIPSPYLSPKRKASGKGGKKLTSSPSTKVSLGLIGSVLGSLKRFRTGGISKLKLPQTGKTGKGKGGNYVKAGSVWERHEGGMEIDAPHSNASSNGPAPTQVKRVLLPPSSPPSTSSTSAQVRPPLAITSAQDAWSAELGEVLFGTMEPMSPSTAMGYLTLGGSSSTPDVTTASAESGSNPFMTASGYQEAMGSRSVDTLPLSPHWGGEHQPWTGCGSTSPATPASSGFNATAEATDKDFEMTPPASPVSISASTRRAHSRGKAVRVLGVEARNAAGVSGRRGAACASYKEAMYKEFERRNSKADEYRDGGGKGTNGTGAERRPSKRIRGRISSN